MSTHPVSATNAVPGSAPVNIVSPIPLPVTEQGVPFATHLCLESGGQDCGVVPNTYAVGAGHHLVIEYVSGVCHLLGGSTPNASVNSVALDVTTGGTRMFHSVPTPYPPPSAGSTEAEFTFGLPTRLYADSSTDVMLGMRSVGSVVCNVMISGRLTTP